MSEDPYVRLAANLWLLTSRDVERIADYSDELLAQRLRELVKLAGGG